MAQKLQSSTSGRGHPAILAGILAAALSAQGCAAGGPVSAGRGAERIPYSFLFVCVQDDARVAIVDMVELEVTQTISLVELGFGAGARPHDIAVDPDGSHWYVSLVGENRVLRFDDRSQLVGTVTMETPGMVEVSPGSGGLLLATRSMSAVSPPPRIGLASGLPWEVEELDVFLPRPHGITVGRDGRYAYTASIAQNRMATVDLESGRVELTDVPGPVHALVQLAVSPDGRTMVGSGEVSGELVVFSLEDPVHPRVLVSVAVGTQPFDPLFAPDGETVWVPVKGSNEVVVVSARSWSVTDRITGEGIVQPHALTFSPDGTRVFVTNNNAIAQAMDDPGVVARAAASLVVIDADTHQVETTLVLGTNLTGLGRRPLR